MTVTGFGGAEGKDFGGAMTNVIGGSSDRFLAGTRDGDFGEAKEIAFGGTNTCPGLMPFLPESAAHAKRGSPRLRIWVAPWAGQWPIPGLCQRLFRAQAWVNLPSRHRPALLKPDLRPQGFGGPFRGSWVSQGGWKPLAGQIWPWPLRGHGWLCRGLSWRIHKVLLAWRGLCLGFGDTWAVLAGPRRFAHANGRIRRSRGRNCGFGGARGLSPALVGPRAGFG